MTTRTTASDQATHGGGRRNGNQTSSDDLAMASKRTRSAAAGDKEPQPQIPVKDATTPFWPPPGKARGG